MEYIASQYIPRLLFNNHQEPKSAKYHRCQGLMKFMKFMPLSASYYDMKNCLWAVASEKAHSQIVQFVELKPVSSTVRPPPGALEVYGVVVTFDP